MKGAKHGRAFKRWIPGLVLLGLICLPEMAPAQEEMASSIRRYKAYEASTGYYEEYEVLPRRQRAILEVPGVTRGLFRYSPGAAQIRIRSRLADSHRAIKFYKQRPCEDCHVEQTRDIHTVRANLTCRQCHGKEPIASIYHYYSPMNPIRKHAYVCSKCHEGASISYSSYVVHMPNPVTRSAKEGFPLLFYAVWIMIGIAVSPLAVFIPHSVMWGVRELFVRKNEDKVEPHKED